MSFNLALSALLTSCHCVQINGLNSLLAEASAGLAKSRNIKKVWC